MNILLTGLIIFFAIHFLPSFTAVRESVVSRVGEGPYKLAFSLLAAVGLALIVWGKATADFIPVYEPPAWGRHVTMLLVLIAFICLVAFHLRGRIRLWLRHPFLTAFALWGIGHLLANGDLASVLLFGSFAVFSILDMFLVNAREPAPRFDVVPRHDAIAVVAGIALYGVILYFHGALFGVPVLV